MTNLKQGIRLAVTKFTYAVEVYKIESLNRALIEPL